MQSRSIRNFSAWIGLVHEREAVRPVVAAPGDVAWPELCYRKRRGDAYFVEGIVTLIVYYVVFMIVGDFAAYFLGLFTEYEWGSQVSLIVFLALYFLFLWVSWVLAVRVTKPKTAEQQSS